MVATVGQALELIAVLWAGIASSFVLRRHRRRINAIRELARDVARVDPAEMAAFLTREQTLRGLEPEDAQNIDARYPRTFIAEQILTEQVAALTGPGAVVLLGLALSVVGSVMSI